MKSTNATSPHVLTSIAPLSSSAMRLAGELQLTVHRVDVSTPASPVLHFVLFPSVEFEVDLRRAWVEVSATEEVVDPEADRASESLLSREICEVSDRNLVQRCALSLPRRENAELHAGPVTRRVRLDLRVFFGRAPFRFSGPRVSFWLPQELE